MDWKNLRLFSNYQWMNYRTSRYGPNTRFISHAKNRHRKNVNIDWLTAQFSIVGLALVKLQLGYVEHYSVRIQHPTNNKRARPRVILLKTYTAVNDLSICEKKTTVPDKNSWDTLTKCCFFPSRSAPLVPLKVVYRGLVTKSCTPTLRGRDKETPKCPNHFDWHCS